MIIVTNVTIYKCEFCKKELKRKHAMVNHEEICDNNPKNKKACYGCIHLQEHDTEYYTEHRGYDGEYDETEHKSHCFRCEKFEKLMFTWKAEKLKLPEKYPETFEDQKRMPNSCRHFKEFENDEKPLFDLPF